MKISYNNIKSGVGSEILWSSANQNVGNGTMTITKSEPDKTVETELNFNGKEKELMALSWNLPVTAPNSLPILRVIWDGILCLNIFH